eukprot:2457508-Amphidinium_carterae.1
MVSGGMHVCAWASAVTDSSNATIAALGASDAPDEDTLRKVFAEAAGTRPRIQSGHPAFIRFATFVTTQQTAKSTLTSQGGKDRISLDEAKLIPAVQGFLKDEAISPKERDVHCSGIASRGRVKRLKKIPHLVHSVSMRSFSAIFQSRLQGYDLLGLLQGTLLRMW